MSTYRLPVLLIILTFFLTLPAAAQSAGTIAGTVVDGDTQDPLPGVNIALRGTERGAATDADGRFRIASVATGTYTLEVRFLGYRPAERSVEVTAGATTRVRVALTPRSVELDGIEVTALRPDLQPTSELQAAAVREANPRDSGELLRSLSGIDAVRRGPVGLDPVVRGLRETEVGVYMDGTRMFPAGPARMDSPMSHFDPTIIQSMEVVKGPYALTWGAGNLSAIRVETRGLETVPPGWAHGRVTSGYDTNFGVMESGASIAGHQGNVAYRFSGAWREGNDYESGGGGTIPSDFLSREMRGKVGYTLAPGSQLSVSAGYQSQRDMDYPGRLLNADYFDAYNLSARWTLESSNGLVRGAEVLGYYNAVDHGMDNDGKPTAQPMEGRMPPFALDGRHARHPVRRVERQLQLAEVRREIEIEPLIDQLGAHKQIEPADDDVALIERKRRAVHDGRSCARVDVVGRLRIDEKAADGALFRVDPCLNLQLFEQPAHGEIDGLAVVIGHDHVVDDPLVGKLQQQFLRARLRHGERSGTQPYARPQYDCYAPSPAHAVVQLTAKISVRVMGSAGTSSDEGRSLRRVR